MKSNLAINSFVINDFCILSKKPLPTPNLCRFFSIFSSGRFIFLTFLSMDIYFEFLVRIIYKGQCSHYTYRYPIVPGAFVEKTIPSPLNYLGTFVGNQLAISVCTYLQTLFCFIYLCVCPYELLHSLYHCCPIVGLE